MLFRSEDTALVKACDAMNKWVSAQITYDWNGNKVVVEDVYKRQTGVRALRGSDCIYDF